MIEIDIRGKSYGDTEVLGPIRCSISAGDCVAVLGPSGIGKTTLLRLVAGLDPDFDGQIRRPERIAMVFQEPTLLPWRSALDNLTLMTGVSPEYAEFALERVGLAGKAGHFPDQLSLGQQRRLALARAFAADPELLIMDEPFASLDENLAEDMMFLTRSLLRDTGAASLLVTHSETEAVALANRMVWLEGRPATLSEPIPVSLKAAQ